MSEQVESVAEAEVAQATNQQQEQTPVDPNKEKSGLQEALMAERRKRQEAEAYNKYMEKQFQAYQNQSQAKPEPSDDEDEYTKELKQYTQAQVQNGIKQALEQQYLQSNPHLVQIDPLSGRTWLEDKLEPILKNKPYLAHAIQTAENRYARALEIIDDYTPKAVESDTRKRLEENTQKPGNPAGVAKTGNVSKLEQLRSMNRREFSEYRAKLRGRSPNIR